ncbi:MAG TPA: efflux RND transporter periplasmic adaptor subunit [Myxococcota bacterium]|nr:efflux RND transporter periplasmic adaptor subunit [Myxococcota bacterium]
MDAERERTLRDDLSALRIDRSAPAKPRPRWLGWAWLAMLVLGFVAASTVTWRLTLGRTREVSVAYASLSAPGAAAGTVLTGSGYVVTGERYIALGVRVPGRIEAYLVEEGDEVKAGEPLVQLDARPYEASLREARAGLREAGANMELRRKELARLEELRRRDVASEADLDVKVNQLRVAEAEAERRAARVAQLELDLEDTVLRAPSDGVVLEKLKEVSEIAVPGGFAGSGDLIRLANLSELRAELDVNESDLSKVRLGQPAQVVPDAYPDRRYAASVVKLAPQINRQKGTLEVEVRILEPDAWLRPDMSVRVTFFEKAAPDAGEAKRVLAPREAIRSDAQGEYAWVVREERLRRLAVRSAGDAGDGRVIVASGLSGGEALVVGDAEGLRENLAVRPAPP